MRPIYSRVSFQPSRAVGLFAIMLLMALGGCATVAPYEREYLTRPGMDVEREGREARFRSHVYDSRAAAIGSSETSGGGCGCN